MRKVREDFPASNEYVYMNAAAISLKPVQVINAMIQSRLSQFRSSMR
jgi:selenocysteine lyase/cysteine desulfurase